MDTSSLVVACIDAEYPLWARDAVKRGARTALEILRSPRLPDRVILTAARLTRPDPEALKAKPHRVRHETARRRGATPAVRRSTPLVTLHTETELTISYTAVTSPPYLDPTQASNRDAIERALAFCAGYGAARYTIDAARFLGGAPWLDPDPLATDAERDAHANQVASHVATIASGFQLVATRATGDPRSAAVTFFLDRLNALVAAEGPAAIWRGAVGRAVRALVQEVRFATTPGQVAELGQRLPEPVAVLALMRYAAGRGPWPFAAH